MFPRARVLERDVLAVDRAVHRDAFALLAAVDDDIIERRRALAVADFQRPCALAKR